jgi:3'-5' exoribonuclease
MEAELGEFMESQDFVDLPVKELKEGLEIKGCYAVRSKQTPRAYRSKPGKYFFIDLSDKTGSIPGKYWGGADEEQALELYNSISVGDVVEITGSVGIDPFDERLVITMNEGVHSLRKCDPSEYDFRDFLPTSKRDLDKLMDEIKEFIGTVQEQHLKQLLDKFFSDPLFVEDFKVSPSAVIHHHNYLGGHLEHTLGVIKLCDTICGYNPELDRDLLITAAILHDIGKLDGYSYKESAAIDQTDEGRFIGHLVMSDRMVRDKLRELDEFPQDLLMKLSHMILSHHAFAEWGSPKRIRTAEAAALHFADQMDAQVKEFLQAIEEGRELEEDEDWAYIHSFGRPVYLK